MDCFDRVGMNVPRKRGGKCACGAHVDFQVTVRRVEHFMVCPVVDRRLSKMTDKVEFDEAAVEAGRRYFADIA